MKYLEDAFMEAAKSEKFTEFMNNAMYPIIIEDSETFGKRIEAENEMYKQLIESMNMAK